MLNVAFRVGFVIVIFRNIEGTVELIKSQAELVLWHLGELTVLQSWTAHRLLAESCTKLSLRRYDSE